MRVFMHPRRSTSLRCLPSCVGAGEKFPEITAGEYLAERFARNPGSRGSRDARRSHRSFRALSYGQRTSPSVDSDLPVGAGPVSHGWAPRFLAGGSSIAGSSMADNRRVAVLVGSLRRSR